MADDTVFTVIDQADTGAGSPSSSFYEKGTIYQAIDFANNALTAVQANAAAAAASAVAAQLALTTFLVSPGFSGIPTAPTAAPGTNTTQLATTAFTTAAVSAEATIRSGADTAEANTRSAADALLAPKASPVFTGVPVAPTATLGTNTTQLATTAFVFSKTGAVKKQLFTASGTYTPSSNLLYAIIECVGGGGGGGAVNGTINQLFQGGGGGSGGYSRTIVSAATVGATQAVTIGAAGAGGSAGANNGTAGGDASLGTLCIAKGGSGGLFGGSAQVGAGGAGGIAGTGDLPSNGMPGNPGIYNSLNNSISFASGNGGSSIFGGGAQGVGGSGGVAGNTASNYGGGGSGASSNGTATLTAAGGNGSKGVVFITEFCSS